MSQMGGLFLYYLLPSSLFGSLSVATNHLDSSKMSLLRLTSPKIQHPPLSNLRRPSSSFRRFPAVPAAGAKIPARDHVIDFGKHRGRMLGSLPSTYLSWISSNLRAGDFEHWARLAGEVLADPFYRDRLEWESADRLLAGASAAHRRNSDSPIADLLAVSDRFGWDNEDKEAWARIDFELLGTSLGGRIPRRAANGEKSLSEMGRGSEGKGKGGTLGKKVGGLRDEKRFVVRQEMDKEEEEVMLGMKERRGKRRERRRVGMQKLMNEVGVLGEEEEGGRSDEEVFVEKKRVLSDELEGGRFVNPFPGRGTIYA